MQLSDLAHVLAPYQNASRWWLAYSGGSDSAVLLHLLSTIPSASRPPVTVVHINHGLSADANTWQRRCEQSCGEYGFAFIAHKVRLDKTSNIEEHARTARYGFFEQLLGPNECLLMAHHQADQLETVLYRLFRGTGIRGLAGMPVERPLGRGVLVRPLLKTPKARIAEYAAQQELRWVDDLSNTDEHYDRNFIRQSVIPLIETRWPSVKQSVDRQASIAAETSQLLSEYAEQDLSVCSERFDTGRVQWSGLPVLNVERLQKLSDARQRQVLRHYLAKHQLILSLAQLNTVLQQFCRSGFGQQPLFESSRKQLRLYCGCLVVCDQALDPKGGLNGIRLIEGRAKLASGIQYEILKTTSADLDATFRYHFAPLKQSMRFRPSWRAHSTTLKKLYQEQAVPAWQRSALYGVWCDDQLAAVPGVGVETAFLAPDQQQGLSVKLEIQQFVYLCQ